MPKTNKTPKNISKSTKQTVEHIKEDAKKYYKWKNMILRYILIWFLFILLLLQFLLPSLDKNKSQEINSDNGTWNIENISKSSTVSWDFSFMGNLVDLNNPDYDDVLTDIVSNKPALELLYKKSLSFLPDLKKDLEDEGIPTDFQYLSLINGLNNPVWILPPEAIDKYGMIVNQDIDETLNTKKSTDVTIEHLKELYEEFGDWDLVLVAYMLGSRDVEEILQEQGQTEFSKVYLEPYAMSWYYEVMAYKYIMENISDYIDTKDITAYPKPNTITIRPWKVDNLIKRAKKKWYSYKEIKKLNPWILWNSLPKVKLDVEVYKK